MVLNDWIVCSNSPKEGRMRHRRSPPPPPPPHTHTHTTYDTPLYVHTICYMCISCVLSMRRNVWNAKVNFVINVVSVSVSVSVCVLVCVYVCVCVCVCV